MALTDSLVSYYKLDESSGNAADSKGSNTLTNNGTAAYTTGKINNGVDLEAAGADQYLSITDASQSGLDITGDISIQAWVKIESAPGNDVAYAMVSKWNSTGDNRSYTFYYLNDSGTPKIVADLRQDGAITRVEGNVTTTLSTGTWYHLVLTSDISTSTFKVYLDGTSQTVSYNAQTGTSIFNGNGEFTIGRLGSNAAFYFDGVIDEVGVWSRELTGAEVTELYNSGNGLAYPFGEGGGAASTGSHFLLMGV